MVTNDAAGSGSREERTRAMWSAIWLPPVGDEARLRAEDTKKSINAGEAEGPAHTTIRP